MGGGGGGDGDQKIEFRYATYIEDAHKNLLSNRGADAIEHSVLYYMQQAVKDPGESVFGGQAIIAPEDSFFGEAYGLNDFPTLYDMYGRFMGGMDICDLWSFMYENVVHAPEIQNAVSAHAALLDDDIETKVLPRFLAGMRDINSVMASSFVIGKSIIENARVKAVNEFQAQIRLRAIDATVPMWQSHLDWNKSVVSMYNQMNKQYFDSSEAIKRTNLEYAAKDAMWNLNLFDYGRDMVAALQNAGKQKSSGSGNEPSSVSKGIGGAMSGAATGAMVGSAVPGIGTAVGAGIGGVLGLASSFL
jgi:hypothetical protein